MQLISFYQFATLADYEQWGAKLLRILKNDLPEVRGSIILAPEGVNANLCGEPEDLAKLVEVFRADERFADLEVKTFAINKPAFKRLKIKCKPEIISFRNSDYNPQDEDAAYLNADEWNKLLAQDDVVLLDARNNFEFELGSFRNAINPKANFFSHLADYIRSKKEELQDKKVAIFCTGGIRCEKLGKYMKQQGIKDVYQLKGGILQYLQDTKPQECLWEGDCFLFDERISIDKNGLAGKS